MSTQSVIQMAMRSIQGLSSIVYRLSSIKKETNHGQY